MMFSRCHPLVCSMVFPLIGVLAASSGATWGHAHEQNRPNVILIMVDDLGYNDLSCFGHPEIKTPVLDQLARDGMRLTGFYSGASVCTPSRMALLTGCYPVRMGWKKGVVGYKMGLREGLHPRAITMAEIFQNAGYTTGISGKWHLGSEPPCRPHRQGFDTSYYIDKSNNQTRQIWRGDEVIEEKFVNRYLTEQFTEQALNFIQRNHNSPFFLYLPYTAPHFPVEAHPDWKGKSGFGAYGDVVEELDARIGEICDALKKLDLAGNTVVVFCSDNGPQPGQAASAYPWRGMKWSALEGGTRVPCIIRWPGKIHAGTSSDELVSAMDLLPTLCHLTGVDLSDALKQLQPRTPESSGKESSGKESSGEESSSLFPLQVDGRSVASILRGTKESLPDRTLLYWHGMGELQAIRKGSWKLFLDRAAALSGLGVDEKLSAQQRQALDDLARGTGPVLFDLGKNKQELVDYSKKNPELVKQLQALAVEQATRLKENTLPLWRPEK